MSVGNGRRKLAKKVNMRQQADVHDIILRRSANKGVRHRHAHWRPS